MAAAGDKTVKLSELLSDRRRCDVKWMEHEFWVEYKPSAITPAMYRATKEVSMAGDRWGAESIKIALVTILTQWSIKDDQGVMIPITVQSLDGLPNDMLHDIYDQCWLDSHPLPTNGNSSNGSSNSAPAPA